MQSLMRQGSNTTFNYLVWINHLFTLRQSMTCKHKDNLLNNQTASYLRLIITSFIVPAAQLLKIYQCYQSQNKIHYFELQYTDGQLITLFALIRPRSPDCYIQSGLYLQHSKAVCVSCVSHLKDGRVISLSSCIRSTTLAVARVWEWIKKWLRKRFE